uniref:Uncharacterized protein n=1 Tax=Spongospora subterranea TaxID=70186 RepID=A0A0H5QXH0_9EUKA|eukprot:CRZ06311.1 hypothetical protein [Spongospora subterranea]
MMQGKPPLNLNATAVPYWANNVFKYLSIVVKKKELKLDRYTEEVAGCLDRIRILSSHIANVQTEISRTQNLLDAKSKCIESEDHLKRLSECELSRLRTDGITVEKEVSDTNEIIHSMQNEMFAAQERIDKFLIQKNWNEEELEQWSLAVKQSEDDAIALSRYCRKDDVILKSGTMKIGHLTKVLFLPH